MASTMDMIKSGAQAAASGVQLDSDKIGDLSSVKSEGAVGPDEDYLAGDSTMEDLLPGSDDNPADSLESEQQASSEGSKREIPVDKEVITISDDKGRRKVEIDFSNRDELKKQIQMAYGARKWQAERDQAIASRKEVAQKLAERDKDWTTLEKAYQQGGAEQLFDLLNGRKGAFQDHVQKQIQRSEFLKNASPEEVQALESRERVDQQSKELERIRKENEDFRKQMTSEREQAELRSVESKVHPVFEKYRFAEKLGDVNDEHMFDEMLWNSALKRLEPYEEQGLELSPELVEREFKAVAAAIRNRIGVQAEKRASKAIDQKKQEATENVQAKVKSGYKTGETAREARSLIESGNLTGLLKNWNKYGGMFRK